MIRFEINESPFALTNDQLVRIYTIIAEHGWDLDYDIVEGDTGNRIWLWIHHEEGNPDRCWIEIDGQLTMQEEVTWDWRGVGTPTPRVDLTTLYPEHKGESAGAWTARLLSHAGEHGTNRQCSIGWHAECSDPEGTQCRCLCHGAGVEYWSVEGDVTKDGAPFVLRAERGKHRWPPKDGEAAGMWAHWILAVSDEDARIQAIKKEEARRG